MLWGEKHNMKSPPDFQRFTEERSPSGVKGWEDTDYCDTKRSWCSTHRRHCGATELWWEALSPAWATEELRAGLASPVLLQLLPCTSDGSRSPSYTREREGYNIQHKPRRVGAFASCIQPKTLVGPCALWDWAVRLERDHVPKRHTSNIWKWLVNLMRGGTEAILPGFSEKPRFSSADKYLKCLQITASRKSATLAQSSK